MKLAEKSAATRARLLDVAEPLFAAHGFAGAGTEAILAGAGLRRGALYHHFADKAALFEAVCRRLAARAAAEVEAAARRAPSPFAALVAGSTAWIGFVTRPEARRILLVDAPTVLGLARWLEIDRDNAARLLAAGLGEALSTGEIVFDGSPDWLLDLVNGALNGLALRIGAADLPAEGWQGAVAAFFERFRPPPPAA